MTDSHQHRTDPGASRSLQEALALLEQVHTEMEYRTIARGRGKTATVQRMAADAVRRGVTLTVHDPKRGDLHRVPPFSSGSGESRS